MKQELSLIVLLILSSSPAAGSPSKTADSAGAPRVEVSVDTLPPVVSCLPQQPYQRPPLWVTLQSSERGALWYGVNTVRAMLPYQNSFPVTGTGKTVVYFFGEDIVGNRSAIDSTVYILDFQPPKLSVKPPGGTFSAAVTVRLQADEPARIFSFSRPDMKDTLRLRDDTLFIQEGFDGSFLAIDRAGNRSTAGPFHFIVDTAVTVVEVRPAGGIYNRIITITLKCADSAEIFYSFDPSATDQYFTRYSSPFRCPYGLCKLRYYTKNRLGAASPHSEVSYVSDTSAPHIRFYHKKGQVADSIVLLTKEESVIFYSRSRTIDPLQGLRYEKPIVINRKAKAFLQAVARDVAGNVSVPFVWEFSYDSMPPVVTASHRSGVYNSAITLSAALSEPGRVVYTLDGSEPTAQSSVLKGGVVISKNGLTIIRLKGIDEAENLGPEKEVRITIDQVPPLVRVRMSEENQGSPNALFVITLQPSEPATVFYEVSTAAPTLAWQRYCAPIRAKSGQMLHYYAVDQAGNRSVINSLYDLQKPRLSSVPRGGVFNKQCSVALTSSIPAKIFWRLSSLDTFKLYTQQVLIDKEGVTAVEYYGVTETGMKSSTVREVYELDWTAPKVSITLKQGRADSISVFFDCSENATVYYTLDGSDPKASSATHTACNKFTRSRDRISLIRNNQITLSSYGEDVAGNQSQLSFFDILKPQVIPSVPPGVERVYDRIITLSLQTYDDQAQIFFERHGRQATTESSLFSRPITLTKSDTITAFAVDQFGYSGQPQTFIYTIDLPPSPDFSVTPQPARAGQEIGFDASSTIDNESPLGQLAFSWNFNGDTVYEATATGNPLALYRYKKGGLYAVSLRVTDAAGHTAVFCTSVEVLETCPPGMAYVPVSESGSFCIDVYEWPNKAEKMPVVNVSWMQAALFCHDQGKRLCSASQWFTACESGAVSGDFDERRKGRGGGETSNRAGLVRPSGSCPNCKNRLGIYDMIGNAWEWVDNQTPNKNNVQPGGSSSIGVRYMVGSGVAQSSGSGVDGTCRQRLESSMEKTFTYTGFRCCR
ncbi:MAG: chitobiase/beta-hexosaminidase C-terminal domain-containing protein [Chitinivibrionales bacterium]|nr:chitobiase/beta-hexosaminidase C-terminal domain-containing protein [Chitinivibrionales bacterium]